MNSNLTSLPIAAVPAEDEALRAQVQRFLQEALKHLPADARSRSWMGFDLEFSRALAAQRHAAQLPRVCHAGQSVVFHSRWLAPHHARDCCAWPRFALKEQQHVRRHFD